MKTTLTAVAVLLALSSTPALAAPNDTPATGKGKSAAPAKSAQSAAERRKFLAMVREKLRDDEHIDPDSPQGKRLTEFVMKYMTDPKAIAALSNLEHATYAPETRMRLLTGFAKTFDGSTDNCGAAALAGESPFEMARTLTPAQFDVRMSIMEALLQPEETPSEHYSITQRLAANAEVHALLTEDRGNARGNPVCAAIARLGAKLETVPKSAQPALTYEIVESMLGRPNAVRLVLTNPQAYLDEAFVAGELPAELRAQLPKEGSHPLPFKRIVVEGQWASKIAGDEVGPVRDTFINASNNGITGEILESLRDNGAAKDAYLALSYGIVPLRDQYLSRVAAQPMSTLPAQQWRGAQVPGNTGSTFVFADTEPADDDYLPVQQCEVGQRRAASGLSQDLTGEAVDVLCSTAKRDGGTASTSHYVWLSDYEIALNVARSVDGKAGKLTVERVTLER